MGVTIGVSGCVALGMRCALVSFIVLVMYDHDLAHLLVAGVYFAGTGIIASRTPTPSLLLVCDLCWHRL